MHWLTRILVVIGVVCVLGGGNDKRTALSVIEGAFVHTVEPDSSPTAFYQEVSAPVSPTRTVGFRQTNARVERNDLRAQSLPTAQGVDSNKRIPKHSVTPLMKKKVAAKQDWTCGCGCEKPLSLDYHVDHIVPLWQHKAGSVYLDPNRESNLQALNPGCHLAKTAREAQVR